MSQCCVGFHPNDIAHMQKVIKCAKSTFFLYHSYFCQENKWKHANVFFFLFSIELWFTKSIHHWHRNQWLMRHCRDSLYLDRVLNTVYYWPRENHHQTGNNPRWTTPSFFLETINTISTYCYQEGAPDWILAPIWPSIGPDVAGYSATLCMSLNKKQRQINDFPKKKKRFLFFIVAPVSRQICNSKAIYCNDGPKKQMKAIVIYNYATISLAI